MSRRRPAHLLDPAAAEEAAARAGVPEVLARLNVFRVLLANEPLAKGVADLLLGLLAGRDLEPRLREIVIMRIGWSTACAYEWTQHWPIATGIGVPADDLIGVRDWQRHHAFAAVDRAVLQATDDSLASGRIGDDVATALEDHLAPEAIVELVAVIGAWSMVSALVRSLDIPLEQGVVAWPPDGASPLTG